MREKVHKTKIQLHTFFFFPPLINDLIKTHFKTCQNRNISGKMFNSDKNDWKGVFGWGPEWVDESVCVSQKEPLHFRAAPWLASNPKVASAMGCSPKQKDVHCLALPNLDFKQWIFDDAIWYGSYGTFLYQLHWLLFSA